MRMKGFFGTLVIIAVVVLTVLISYGVVTLHWVGCLRCLNGGVIEYGKRNNDGLVQDFSGFSDRVPGRLVGVWPSRRCGNSHYIPGSDGNHKSQIMNKVKRYV